jgi:hypothetical protein
MAGHIEAVRTEAEHIESERIEAGHIEAERIEAGCTAAGRIAAVCIAVEHIEAEHIEEAARTATLRVKADIAVAPIQPAAMAGAPRLRQVQAALGRTTADWRARAYRRDFQ